jgi:arylsulfatase A-like enzyme
MAGMDFAPSLLTFAGIAAPEKIKFDGLDMSATLTGKASPQRDKQIMWVRPPDRPGPDNAWPDLAIRDGKWKLLVHRDGSKPELFDILADPTESKNLAATHADVTQRLGQQVIAWDKSIK